MTCRGSFKKKNDTKRLFTCYKSIKYQSDDRGSDHVDHLENLLVEIQLAL